MIVRSVDLPSLRDETAEYTLKFGPTLYENAIKSGRQHCRPVAGPTRGGQILTAAEVRRLKEAELFHVSADMTDLALAAGSTLPHFDLMPDDLPSPAGFIVYDKPIDTIDYGRWYEGENGESPIVAASWSHWDGNNPAWIHGGIWVTWYADFAGMMASGIARGSMSEDRARELRRDLATRLVIDNESQSAFSPDPIPVADEGETIYQRMATLKATWLLMTQPVAVVADASFNRTERRQLMRQAEEPPRVRVITLRRPASSSTGDSDREYHHQWVVRGHWRQQWYPSRNVHRPVWIAPHIKGPEGAPMLGGEKVYSWTR